MSKTTHWWWIRHAPVRGHEGKIYGRRDVACDLSDTAAFERLAQLLPERGIWISSPLSRTIETAKALALLRAGNGRQPPIVTAEPDILEQDFGNWQGLTYGEIADALGGESHPLWFAPADVTPDGGESFAETMVRVASAIKRLTQAHAGKNIVAVAHAGVIRAAAAHALGLDADTALRFAVEPLSLTRLDHLPGPGHGLWRVVGVNTQP